jgi:hypothetical protein
MAGAHVSIGADSKKAERELKSFERKTRKIAKSIQKGFQERIGHKLFDGLMGAARAVPGILNDAIKAASDLNEELSKSETIFKEASLEIEEFANGAAESMGLAKTAALEATGTIGNMFTAMGMSGKEAADMSMNMVKLAADLGSFNNTSTDDAIQAIGAALRGESEPIRRYGVLLDDATLKAEALTKGLYDGKGALEPASRALSAYSVILKQTTSAQGDFAKTSDGLANSKKILNAELDNAKSLIGQELLPAMKSFISYLRDVDWQSIGEGIGSIAKAILSLTETASNGYIALKRWVSITQDAAQLKKITDPDVMRSIIEANKRDGIGFFAEEPKKQESESDKFFREFNEEYERQLSEKADKAAKNQALDKARDVALIAANIFKKPPRQTIAGAATKIASKKAQEETLDQPTLMDTLKKRMEEVQDSLNQSSSLSGNLAVSSMQRIGGGGGVASTLDIQKRQANLQAEMVELLKQINSAGGMGSGISDF